MHTYSKDTSNIHKNSHSLIFLDQEHMYTSLSLQYLADAFNTLLQKLYDLVKLKRSYGLFKIFVICNNKNQNGLINKQKKTK